DSGQVDRPPQKRWPQVQPLWILRSDQAALSKCTDYPLPRPVDHRPTLFGRFLCLIATISITAFNRIAFFSIFLTHHSSSSPLSCSSLRGRNGFSSVAHSVSS